MSRHTSFPVLLSVHWLKSPDPEAPSGGGEEYSHQPSDLPLTYPGGPVFIILRPRTRLPPCLPALRRTFEGFEETSYGELIFRVPLVSAISSLLLRHAPVAD